MRHIIHTALQKAGKLRHARVLGQHRRSHTTSWLEEEENMRFALACTQQGCVMLLNGPKARLNLAVGQGALPR